MNVKKRLNAAAPQIGYTVLKRHGAGQRPRARQQISMGSRIQRRQGIIGQLLLQPPQRMVGFQTQRLGKMALSGGGVQQGLLKPAQVIVQLSLIGLTLQGAAIPRQSQRNLSAHQTQVAHFGQAGSMGCVNFQGFFKGPLRLHAVAHGLQTLAQQTPARSPVWPGLQLQPQLFQTARAPIQQGLPKQGFGLTLQHLLLKQISQECRIGLRGHQNQHQRVQNRRAQARPALSQTAGPTAPSLGQTGRNLMRLPQLLGQDGQTEPIKRVGMGLSRPLLVKLPSLRELTSAVGLQGRRQLFQDLHGRRR